MRSFLIISVLSVFVLSACSPDAATKSQPVTPAVKTVPVAAKAVRELPKTPNIIFILSDDAGYDDFGFHGSNVMKTPNFDKMAKDGMIFRQAYISDPTCGPSRAGILTGRYQQKFGFEENNVPSYMSPSSKFDGEDMGIPLTEKTMGDRLQSLGYKTAIFGKWHVGGADRFHPTVRGFDEFFGFRGGRRSYFNKNVSNASDGDMDKMERGFENYIELDTYLTDALGNETADFITANKDRPFFAFVSFNAPHTPMEATEEDLAQFPNLTGKRKIVAAMTLAMDRATGHIMDTLEQHGLTENTLIIFTNDNGGPTDQNASNNFPYAGTKSNHLEGGLRVPFVAKWPGVIPAGSEFEPPVSTLDLLPTFFQAAGGDASTLEKVDGVNLLPYVLGEKTTRPHQPLFWKKDARAAVRDGDWKLIRFPDRPAELYDLSKSTDEQVSLAAEHPEKVRELYKKIFEWEMTHELPLWRLGKKWEKWDIDRMDSYREPAKRD